MNRKAFQSEAYCFITVGCTKGFTSTGTWSFMLLQLSWIRYYLKTKATSVASTVVFPGLISLKMWVPWTPRERRLGSCSLQSMATPGSFPCSTKWLQRLQGTMWDIGAEESSHLLQIGTDCSVNCSPPGIQLRRAQAAAAKPCLSCFLLWHSLLCTSRRVFGRLFCGVWRIWKACSQKTLDTKYLLCWHLYYKLLAPVKQSNWNFLAKLLKIACSQAQSGTYFPIPPSFNRKARLFLSTVRLSRTPQAGKQTSRFLESSKAVMNLYTGL